MREYTYAEVGATRHEPLPAGYHHARRRERIGHGRAAFDAASHGLMTWAVQRGAGIRVDSTSAEVREGVELLNGVGIGPLRLRAPCRVVWTVEEPRRVGFAYGTLQGHPESGEESLILEIDDHDDVWFTITVFSRAAAWYAKIGGPVTRALQSFATRRYVDAARHLANPQ
ncbi:DUF1990 domain-containing protein [Phytoactinopolyspora alkaliphila]|uniref:DUF1990 domain-containing protein n=1 Tax=Phytoactinopolyspora alkaliphila TaxID=1783498 RepID=A0A6N9YKG5_9ACTN|nr:DUF1990 domain-containing protein [Phytoactinopolyspora alkaliphila]NED95526.1 DUF1990 domain-containing protein [Phytoactinopolyspora alkaliphila]